MSANPLLNQEVRHTRFVEIFRTTPARTVCPNFYVLSHANGCSFEPRCKYCYLKSTFWYLPQPRVYGNSEKMMRDILAWIAKDRLESYVLNTGNLSDSLCFEGIRPIVKDLVELFRTEAEHKARPHSVLLVTKGGISECQPLLEIQPSPNVIVSFSVNDNRASRDFEAGAPAADDRFAAANALKDVGWRIRIRIDPILRDYDYSPVAEKVADLGPERVTLGCLRSEKGLLRFLPPELRGALEPCSESDTLARYPRAERLRLYRPIVNRLQGICPLGLCEETLDVWQETLPNQIQRPTCNCGL